MSLERVYNNRTGLPLWELVFMIIACLYYSNYFVQSSYAYPIIAGFTGYVAYCYVKIPEYRKKIFWFMLLLLLFSFLYLVLTDTSSININVSNRNVKRLFSKYSQYLLMFFPLLMLYRTATHATLKQIYLLLGIIVVDLTLLAQTALTAVEINQNILHSMREESVAETGMTIAAYYFVYAYTFLLLICIICYKYAKKPYISLFSIIIFIAVLYFLFKAQFALSIVTCFISILYLYFSITRDKNSRFFVIIGLLIVLFLLPFIIKALVSVLPDNILKDRLNEVYGMISGEAVSSDKDGQYRLELYWMCIKAFFTSPLVGNRTLPEDGHATLLTVPADIGIYGLFFLYITFKNAYYTVKRVLGRKIIFYKPLMFQIILMGLTNPIHSSPANYILLFFLCPLVIILFIDDNRKVGYVLRAPSN